MRRFDRAARLVLAASGCVLALACGSAEDEAPRATGRAMVAPGASAASGSAEAEGNSAPVIERVALSPESPLPDADLQAVVTASDPDGDPIRLTYVWTVNGVEVARGNRPMVKLHELNRDDEVEVVVVASDGPHESEPVSRSARVGNRPPVLSAVTLDPFGDVRAGQVIHAVPHAQDPDNDVLQYRYTWTVNGEEQGHDDAFDTKGLHRGDKLQVAVVAEDRHSESREVSSPVLPLGNTPPMIRKLPAEQYEGGTFRYAFEAEDPDGDHNLRFYLAQAPQGMQIDPVSGVLTWTPQVSQAGTHAVEVGVKDGAGEGSTFLFNVTVSTSGSAPPPPPASQDEE